MHRDGEQNFCGLILPHHYMKPDAIPGGFKEAVKRIVVERSWYHLSLFLSQTSLADNMYNLLFWCFHTEDMYEKYILQGGFLSDYFKKSIELYFVKVTQMRPFGLSKHNVICLTKIYQSLYSSSHDMLYICWFVSIHLKTQHLRVKIE